MLAIGGGKGVVEGVKRATGGGGEGWVCRRVLMTSKGVTAIEGRNEGQYEELRGRGRLKDPNRDCAVLLNYAGHVELLNPHGLQSPSVQHEGKRRRSTSSTQSGSNPATPPHPRLFPLRP